ncbi:pyridoxal phosphate-dependent aminotransferase [Clostridium chrysemydis]|uniref:pyridoxal phosphate-dependent aminotransferase n=1 Tax=Clostridium chrysemydis TaxID=2665504 RepID=UPI0018835B13|nr:histidinol-phosphate transaminase [Clostridium chrysemydis]
MSVKHGANLFDLENELKIDKSEIKDFSSNINPFGASKKAKKAVCDNIDMVSIYPDPEYKKLKDAIGYYCNSKKENIILGSGATELISSFISTISPKKALLISPAYSEYKKELLKVNCEVVDFFSKKENDFKIDKDEFIKEINSKSYDLVIICNPNNPTGFAFNRDEIKSILENTNTFIMIDETYIEFTNTKKYSSTPLVDDFNKLFVIRGTSKFFSTPGIRLGYGLISDKDIFQSINKKLDLWNINIFGVLMGEVMFKDEEYINFTIKHMEKGREYLYNNLKDIDGIKAYESKGNFILCEITKKDLNSKKLYEMLLEKGMIIRDCSSFTGLSENFFRVCILKEEENKKLIKNLKDIINM